MSFKKKKFHFFFFDFVTPTQATLTEKKKKKKLSQRKPNVQFEPRTPLETFKKKKN